VQHSDRNATFLTAVAPHLDELRARARRMCPADADDLLQDVLERALRSGCTPDHARAWFFAILNRLLIDHARRRLRRPHLTTLDDAIVPMPDIDPDVEPPPIPSEALHAAVDALPVELKRTWRLRVDERLDYAAVAARLGIPTGTVGTRLRRARQLLRTRLLPAA
jgi:RNA polymerase sigma-70 factor, ECF subfamily